MKRLIKIMPLFCLLPLLLAVKPLWAVTYAYIPSYANDKVVRVATAVGTFTSATITEDNSCGPYGVAVAPDGTYVLVTCEKNDQLVVLNDDDFTSDSAVVPSGQIYSSDLAHSPRGIAIEPQGHFAYITNYGGATAGTTVLKVDLSNPGGEDGIEAITVGSRPFGVAAIHVEGDDLTKVYVANYASNNVSIITDDGTDITTETVNVGTDPVGVAASPDGRYVYVANYTNGATGTVSIIRADTDALVRNVTVGSGPWGVAVGSQGDYLYVSNSDTLSNSVSLIRTSDNTVLNSYAVGTLPHGAAAPKNGDFAYVLNQVASATADDTISKIDISSSSVEVTTVTPDNDHPIDTAGIVGPFIAIGGTPPLAPSGLSGTAEDANTITLTWSDNSNDEAGFKIERRIEGETAYEEIGQAQEDEVTFTDEGLTGETTYEYRIRAFNEAADSGYDATDTDSGITTEENEEFSWCFIGTLWR